ncbi:hypothetical protein ACIHEI_37295 [Kitasatospora sp. NPDC051984]|uniref:hypothetical protein n=1 Tax=Kitasatospora sp. NPDC051984 TaxID=3364059 RepID=UPI0037C842C6
MDGAGRAGGSAGLIRLLDRHDAEVAADLRRFYGVDVLDWFRGRHSARYVLALIGTLPDGSATVAAMRGGREAAGWDAKAYVLADLVDAIQALTHIPGGEGVEEPAQCGAAEAVPAPIRQEVPPAYRCASPHPGRCGHRAGRGPDPGLHRPPLVAGRQRPPGPGGLKRVKSGLREIGSGAAEVARNVGRLFTLSIPPR